MAGGRPSLYKKRYCKLIIEMGKEGKMPIHWASEIGVCRDTLTEWCSKYPEFSSAYAKAKTLGEKWEIERVEADPSRLNLAKWKLSAYYRRSETVKQEVKQETKSTVTHKLQLDFGDRED